MAITSAFWNFDHADGRFEGYDIHVVRGPAAEPDLSRRLDTLLQIKDGVEPNAQFKSASDDGGHPFGTTPRFVAEFQGAPGPAHGVQKVDAVTGEVKLSGNFPATRLFNFLIRAEVKLADDTIFAMQPRIRVHVHQSVVDAWLTPSPLSVRKGADGQRFGILAEFDDGTVGDISRVPGIRWESTDETKVKVLDTATGTLSVQVESGTFEVIKAILPARWGGREALGKVMTLPPWSKPRNAHLVRGHAALRDEVANFLFLPEGFGPGEKDRFDEMVETIVRSFRSDENTSPFCHLNDSINYWSAWIESRQRGATVLCEVNERVPPTGRKFWMKTPAGRKPDPPPPSPAPAPFWQGDEMFHEVGLPVRADLIPAGASNDQIEDLFDAKKTVWETLYGDKVRNRIDLPGFINWCSWWDRRLIDDQDTALGLALDERPRHEYPVSANTVGWRASRTTRAHLDPMLDNLTHRGEQLQGIWTGKDRPFVFALLGGTRYGATAFDGLVAVSVIPQEEVLVQAVGSRRAAIDPFPLPTVLPPSVAWTAAHEMGHHLGLGDEYAGPGTLDADAGKGLAASPNLQDLESLSNPAPSPPAPQVRPLDGAKLKWVWHRIQKAGVVAEVPTADGAGFKVKLNPRHLGFFKKDDEVFLRNRLPSVPSAISVRLKVLAVTSDALKVESLGGGGGRLPPDFPENSVVYVPVKSDAGAPLEMVAATIRTHLTTTGQPLNAATGSPPTRPCDPTKPYTGYQPGNNLPPGLVLKAGVFRGWVVGAYEGGSGRQCGVYHPAGACMMSENRGQQDPRDPPVVSTDPRIDYLVHDKAYQFCPICRYVIVDVIDPTRHKKLDDWYRNSGRYPT